MSEKMLAPLPAGVEDTLENRARLEAACRQPGDEECEIRVVRILEYVGTKSAVERTLARSFVQNVRVVGRDLTITAAPIARESVLDAARVLDAALNAARAEHEKLADLTSETCAALGWPPPQTPSERSNAAEDAWLALIDSDTEPPPHWPLGPTEHWRLFRDKLRTLKHEREQL